VTFDLSCAGLTRASMQLHRPIDRRVKPGNDEEWTKCSRNTLCRRAFITLLGAAAATWPLAARAQQNSGMRLIGVLMSVGSDDAAGQARFAAFLQGLQEFGWSVGRNVRIETRWCAGKQETVRKYAAELVALGPDVILASGGSVVGDLLQATHIIPIVFTLTTDPVGAGYVRSLARPGGNATGFTGYEYGLSVKWLDLLKQIAPQVTRVAVLRDATLPEGIGQFAVMQAAASPLALELRPIDLHDADEIERDIAAFARDPNGGLIVSGSSFAVAHRDLIIALAARHQLPAVYFQKFFVAGGGLISYGPDDVDPHRRAAGYVDRILKGEKPSDLPVQADTKYRLTINLKTAKTLGLTIPQALLATADEVIE
jgi:putative tryptophan/tyrosine transport system substrate-binding protein